MKKLQFRKKNKGQLDAPSRITNETVAEHRERILAGGRRFKYPLQYARHRLVINTILISLAALILLIVFGWWQLYPAQNTGSFFYQVTRVLPLPVASVDGESVRYSDYLMQYKSSVHFSQQIEGVSLSGKDGESQKNYYKRMALDNAITDSYAQKLARSLDITVTSKEIDELVQTHLTANDGKLSRDAYNAVIKDQYGWGEDEYLRTLERQLLRQKVSVAVDKNAETVKMDLEKNLLADGSNFDALAKSQGVKVTVESSGLVKYTNSDGGRAAEAAKLKVGQISKPFISRSIDGYYIVKLLQKTDDQVSYVSIKIPLTEFKARLANVKSDSKISEYISIAETQSQNATEDK